VLVLCQLVRQYGGGGGWTVPAKTRTLELLAAVERITVLEQLEVVLGDVVDLVLDRVDLAESELVVVAVVQHVHEVSVKGVDVLDTERGLFSDHELGLHRLLHQAWESRPGAVSASRQRSAG